LYNLHLGAAFEGIRLNVLHRESLTEKGILAELDRLFTFYTGSRQSQESFGDFLHRSGLLGAEETPATLAGACG
jgi:sulfite reductase (NADPH) hemoprotein beta-component